MLDLSELTNEQLASLIVATMEQGPITVRDQAIEEYYSRTGINYAPVTSTTTPPLLKKSLPQPFAGEHARLSGGGLPPKSHVEEVGIIFSFIIVCMLTVLCFALMNGGPRLP